MKSLIVATASLLLFASGCSRPKPSTAIDFQKKKECAERSEAYLKRERSIDTPPNGINAFVRNEQYRYSRSLNTCLLYFEVVDFDAGTTYCIVDTLEGKKMYYHVTYKDPATQRSFDELCKPSEGCLNQNDFEKKRTELFNGSD
jgi:hypothetical protein